MTITLELTPEEETRLREVAARQGTTIQDYARRLLGLATITPSPASPEAPTGAQLLAQLKADGVIGAWADREDIGETADAPETEHAAKAKALAALMQQWREEDAAMTPKEAEQAEADFQTLMHNIEANPLSLRVPDVSGHD